MGIKESGRRSRRDLMKGAVLGAGALFGGIGVNPMMAAAIAKEAYRTGRTVREVAREKSGIPVERLNELLDPRNQTKENRNGS